MALKELLSPHHGRTVKLGRKRPVAIGPRMHLARYLLNAVPPPPAKTDYSAKALATLANVYGNDELGCCVISGGYHVVGVETGNADKEWKASKDQIIADYGKIGGYIPGHPETDNGCDENTALDYWQNHGFADGTKILGSLVIDGTNMTEVMQAMYLFENLILCAELPAAWIAPFPSGDGFTWDVAGPPDLNNGHSIMACGYDARGVQIDTWGMLGTLTWKALAKYCVRGAYGSLNVVLTPDQLAKGHSAAPNGLNWSALVADFDAMGGHVPLPPDPTPPAPTPPSPPQPAPTATMTLLQAQLIAIDKLHTGPGILLRPHAEKLVTDSIAMHWPKV